MKEKILYQSKLTHTQILVTQDVEDGVIWVETKGHSYPLTHSNINTILKAFVKKEG